MGLVEERTNWALKTTKDIQERDRRIKNLTELLDGVQKKALNQGETSVPSPGKMPGVIRNRIEN